MKTLLGQYSYLLAALLATAAVGHPLLATECGWAVGSQSDGYASIIATKDGTHWFRQGTKEQFANVTLQGVKALSATTCWTVGFKEEKEGTNTTSCGVIFRTEDGGEHWTQQARDQNLPNLQGITATDAKSAWVVGMKGAVYRSTNGGASWINVDHGQIKSPQLQGSFALDNGSVWVSGVYDEKSMRGCLPIYFSRDDGDTWSLQKNSSTNQPESILALSGDLSGNHLYAVGGKPYLIYTSTDRGASWVRTVNTPTGGEFDCNDVITLDGVNAWIAADNGNLWLSHDSGATWTKAARPSSVSPDLILGITTPDGINLWATGTRRGKSVVLHSSDGGQSWVLQAEDLQLGSLWKVSVIKTSAVAAPLRNLSKEPERARE